MPYAIYLNDTRLPVNPEKLDSKVNRTIKKYDVIGQGKVGKPESCDLKEWSWSSEFPDQDYPYCARWQPPTVFIQMIIDLLNSKDPCKLVVSGNGSFALSKQVLVESFSYSEVREGSYEYSINVVEYVESKIQEVGIPYIARPGILVKQNEPKIRPDNDKPKETFKKIARRGLDATMLYDSVTDKPVSNPVIGNPLVTIYPPNSQQAIIAANMYTAKQQKKTTESINKAMGSFMAMNRY